MKYDITEKFNQLPPDLQQKAIDYINLLLSQKELRRLKKPKFSWIGALEELRDQYTSVELQEKASEWWAESALRKLAKNQKGAEEERE